MTTRRTFGYVRKLPSKRYQASYLGANGVRFNAPYTFNTKSDANSWLAVEESALRKGTWTDPTAEATPDGSVVTFETYAKRHIAIQTTRDGLLLRKSTQALYARLLETKLTAFHSKTLTEINSAEVAEWWAKSIAGGKVTSTSKAYKLLSSVMKRAVDEGLLVVNPCKVKGAQNADSGKKVTWPNPDEVSIIATAINPRYKVLVVLAAYSGLRFGEITELRRKDFKKIERIQDDGTNVLGFEVNIDRGVTLVHKEFILDDPKSSAGVRKVPISSQLTPMIDDHLVTVGNSPDSLVFPAASGGHLRHDVFMNSWNPALKRIGLENSGYTPHSLRHFAGTYLAKAGANLPELKKFMGDKSTSAVMRYIHATNRNDLLAEAMEYSLSAN
jgi:integrase